MRCGKVGFVEKEIAMPAKLTQGDKLPDIILNLTDKRSLDLPRDMSGSYLVLLFYRGNW